MKLLSIVGARPQFIKAAVLSRELRKAHREIIVHTGQHYDDNMSRVFFEELEMPEPDHNLGVGSGRHGAQTGLMLERIEEVLLKEKPERVIVYGDTNSTLAGALAAAKLHISVAHVEAGLRSFNREMPEEVNRVLADHLSDLLFCPSSTAADNLKKEGINHGVHLVGDIMCDALQLGSAKAGEHSGILNDLGLEQRKYLLATVHRAENTDDKLRLQNILTAFSQIPEPIVFPLHPRTRRLIKEFGLSHLMNGNVQVLPPVGYLDMIRLEQAARMILTDSGGMQKEAYWLHVPCITLRRETEWVETVAAGWNFLAGTDADKIVQAVTGFTVSSEHPPLYGDGKTAVKIAKILRKVT